MDGKGIKKMRRLYRENERVELVVDIEHVGVSMKETESKRLELRCKWYDRTLGTKADEFATSSFSIWRPRI